MVNYVDYYDLQILTDNLKDYLLLGIPLQVISKLVSEGEGSWSWSWIVMCRLGLA